MEKNQAYIIATAIVVAGLIVAAAMLVVEQPGRYVPSAVSAQVMLDTQTGTVWQATSGVWESYPLP